MRSLSSRSSAVNPEGIENEQGMPDWASLVFALQGRLKQIELYFGSWMRATQTVFGPRYVPSVAPHWVRRMRLPGKN